MNKTTIMEAKQLIHYFENLVFNFSLSTVSANNKPESKTSSFKL